jgi:ABC-type branched-subunit amino acid transport system permease subunit
VLAFFDGTEEVCMFALSAILIGVIGVLYVRRRSSRKKQSV